MMKCQKLKYVSLSLTLIFLWILFQWIKSDNNNHFTNNYKTSFLYSPNDTHCPIATFKEEPQSVEEFKDECRDESEDWINVINNYAVFNDSKVNEVGVPRCFYKQILWKTDFEASLSSSWKEFINNTFLGKNNLLVRCKGKSLFHYYERYLFGFEYTDDVKMEMDHRKDILIIGIDSVSRMAWKRLLRKSYDYIEKEMAESSVMFKKVNVLGDGTTVNVLGILAGELEMEVYESRKGYPHANYVDEYPWIWKTLKKKDYVTYYDEDDVMYGTFQYRLMGFKFQPTDFYGRKWRMIREEKKQSFRCINNKNIFQNQLWNLKTFFRNVKRRKFVFTWSTHFSHNVNEEVSVLDESLVELLKEVNNAEGMFKDTILVLMSDHGHRFNSRLHLQGKYEERLPFLSIHLPKSLIKNRPKILENMKKNENKLITTLDVYASLMDMVNNFTFVYSNTSEIQKISLFSSNIPFRSCSEVKIAAHWCSCLKLIEVSITEDAVKEAAKHIVKVINNETEEYRTKCTELSLDKILQAHSIKPSEDVLKFQESDRHGRVPKMSDNTKVDGVYFRIYLQTIPGDAIFEATINMKKRNERNEFKVNVNDIDRNNRYADWIWCLDKSMRDVRKYCLCK